MSIQPKTLSFLPLRVLRALRGAHLPILSLHPVNPVLSTLSIRASASLRELFPLRALRALRGATLPIRAIRVIRSSPPCSSGALSPESLPILSLPPVNPVRISSPGGPL